VRLLITIDFEHSVAHRLIEVRNSHLRVIRLPLVSLDANFWQDLSIEVFAGDEGHINRLQRFPVKLLLR
jgi:hypothetical protein